jgi:putative transcriptional regulator
MHMTQKQFSRQFGLSARTLQDWEQGRRNPTGVSRVLLQVLAKEPDAVIRALQG